MSKLNNAAAFIEFNKSFARLDERLVRVEQIAMKFLIFWPNGRDFLKLLDLQRTSGMEYP